LSNQFFKVISLRKQTPEKKAIFVFKIKINQPNDVFKTSTSKCCVPKRTDTFVQNSTTDFVYSKNLTNSFIIIITESDVINSKNKTSFFKQLNSKKIKETYTYFAHFDGSSDIEVSIRNAIKQFEEKGIAASNLHAHVLGGEGDYNAEKTFEKDSVSKKRKKVIKETLKNHNLLNVSGTRTNLSISLDEKIHFIAFQPNSKTILLSEIKILGQQ
jgi:hypothetical protein